MELAKLVLKKPELAAKHGETLASLPFSDASLDTLRHELLNLAASGSPLDCGGVENHLVRRGMAELVARLNDRAVSGEVFPMGESAFGGADAEDAEARFLRAAAQLREMAELEPERQRAAERFKNEATEASWDDYHRLRELPHD